MLVLLVQDISVLAHMGEHIIIPANTQVFLDYKEGVAFWNNEHFYLEKHEFIFMN